MKTSGLFTALFIKRIKKDGEREFTILSKITQYILVLLMSGIFNLPFMVLSEKELNATTIESYLQDSSRQFDKNDLNVTIDQANSKPDENEWLDVVNDGLSVLEAGWETEVEGEIARIVAQVTASDSLRTTNDYKAAANATLNMEKEAAQAEWEKQAQLYIAQELALFRKSQTATATSDVIDNTTQDTAYNNNNPQNVNELTVDTSKDETKPASSYTEGYYDAKDTWSTKQEELFGINGEKGKWVTDSLAAIQSGINEWNAVISAMQSDKQNYLTELNGLSTSWQSQYNTIMSTEANVKSRINAQLTGLESFLTSVGGSVDGQAQLDGYQNVITLISNIRTQLNGNGSLVNVAQSMQNFWNTESQSAKTKANNVQPIVTDWFSESKNYAQNRTKHTREVNCVWDYGVNLGCDSEDYYTYSQDTSSTVYKALTGSYSVAFDSTGRADEEELATEVWTKDPKLGGTRLTSVSQLHEDSYTYYLRTQYRYTNLNSVANKATFNNLSDIYKSKADIWGSTISSLNTWYAEKAAFMTQYNEAITSITKLKSDAVTKYNQEITTLQNNRDEWIWNTYGQANAVGLTATYAKYLESKNIDKNSVNVNSTYSKGLSIWSQKQSQFNTIKNKWYTDAKAKLNTAAAEELAFIEESNGTISDLNGDIAGSEAKADENAQYAKDNWENGNFWEAYVYTDQESIYRDFETVVLTESAKLSGSVSKSYGRTFEYKKAERDAAGELQLTGEYSPIEKSRDNASINTESWQVKSNNYSQQALQSSTDSADAKVRRSELEVAVRIKGDALAKEQDLLKKAAALSVESKKLDKLAIESEKDGNVDEAAIYRNKSSELIVEMKDTINKGYTDIEEFVRSEAGSANLTFTKNAMITVAEGFAERKSMSSASVESELARVNKEITKAATAAAYYIKSKALITEAIEKKKQGRTAKVEELLAQANELASRNLSEELAGNITSQIAEIEDGMPTAIVSDVSTASILENVKEKFAAMKENLAALIGEHNAVALPDIEAFINAADRIGESLQTAAGTAIISLIEGIAASFEKTKQEWQKQITDAMAAIPQEDIGYVMARGSDTMVYGTHEIASGDYKISKDDHTKFENYSQVMMTQYLYVFTKLPGSVDRTISILSIDPSALNDDPDILNTLMSEMSRVQNEMYEASVAFGEFNTTVSNNLQASLEENGLGEQENNKRYSENVQTEIKNAIERNRQFYEYDEFVIANAVIGVAAVVAAPFTGGATLAAFVAMQAAMRAKQAYDTGGYKGLGVGIASGALSGVISAYTAGAVSCNVTWSEDGGWGGSVTGGYGPLSVTTEFTEDGFEGVTAGIEIGGITVGGNWSQDGGWGANAGVTVGGVTVGANYSSEGGWGANIGYKTDSYNADVTWGQESGFGGSVGGTYENEYGKFDGGISYGQNGYSVTSNTSGGLENPLIDPTGYLDLDTNTASTLTFDADGNYTGANVNVSADLTVTEALVEKINDGLSSLFTDSAEMPQDPLANSETNPAIMPKETKPEEVKEDFWEALDKKVAGALNSAVDSVVNTVVETASDAWNGIKEIGNDIVDVANAAWEGIKDIGNDIADLASDAWNGLQGLGESVVNLVTDGHFMTDASLQSYELEEKLKIQQQILADEYRNAGMEMPVDGYMGEGLVVNSEGVQFRQYYDDQGMLHLEETGNILVMAGYSDSTGEVVGGNSNGELGIDNEFWDVAKKAQDENMINQTEYWMNEMQNPSYTDKPTVGEIISDYVGESIVVFDKSFADQTEEDPDKSDTDKLKDAGKDVLVEQVLDPIKDALLDTYSDAPPLSQAIMAAGGVLGAVVVVESGETVPVSGDVGPVGVDASISQESQKVAVTYKSGQSTYELSVENEVVENPNTGETENQTTVGAKETYESDGYAGYFGFKVPMQPNNGGSTINTGVKIDKPDIFFQIDATFGVQNGLNLNAIEGAFGCHPW